MFGWPFPCLLPHNDLKSENGEQFLKNPFWAKINTFEVFFEVSNTEWVCGSKKIFQKTLILLFFSFWITDVPCDFSQILFSMPWLGFIDI